MTSTNIQNPSEENIHEITDAKTIIENLQKINMENIYFIHFLLFELSNTNYKNKQLLKQKAKQHDENVIKFQKRIGKI